MQSLSFEMPFYGCQTLKASSLPASQVVSLEELLRREEAANPFCIYSLARLVSRLIRENSCQWLVKNVTPLIKNDRSTPQKLSDVELENLILHLLSIALETIAAAELAGEDIYFLFAIKQIMISVRFQAHNSVFL